MSLLALDEARAYVLDRVAPLGPVRLPLAACLGHVTAESIVAREAVPPFANSAMDGFAVRSADLAEATGSRPVELTVVHTQAAGAPPSIGIETGQAIRIMTGAVMPPGADAVVMIERVHVRNDVVVGFVAPAPVGDNIRDAGSDLAADAVAIEPGTLLRPAHVGVIASAGWADVAVIRRPRVGVLSTGDELVPPGEPLAPGQIRDSNRPALLATLAAVGCEPVDLGSARDDETAIEQALRIAVDSCDAIVTSGGVSVGDFDWVKVVLDRLGEMRWMQLAIRPAKPFAFGVVCSSDDRPVPVFGLPGNPVSSLVSFELLARPALRQMAGITPALPQPVTAVLAGALERRSDGKVHYVRVATEWVDGQLVARSAGGQGSHQLGAMAAAGGLAIVPDGPGLASGAAVEILALP